ncbi:hypothetical protein [Catenulispora subtropica]|uniref:Crystal protein ET79 n=1 Tax=Catenulispora subtropica TaxID=450798 RepID=A0ABN2TGN9_9ACTN
MSSIRKTAAALLVAGVAAVPVVSVSSASAAVAHPQPASSAARSVQAFVTNDSGCTMTLFSDSLSGGIWTIMPEFTVPNGAATSWESESNGLWTGTEGVATYRLGNCVDPAQNLKFAVFHWDDPYATSNEYDNVGTSSGVHITRSGGSGNNAIVNWVVTTS